MHGVSFQTILVPNFVIILNSNKKSEFLCMKLKISEIAGQNGFLYYCIPLVPGRFLDLPLPTIEIRGKATSNRLKFLPVLPSDLFLNHQKP